MGFTPGNGRTPHLVGVGNNRIGKERLTADIVSKDPLLASQFEYLSKPFVSTPDFAGTIGGQTYTFDITTDASVASHLTRSYGPTTTYITYPGLPPGLVFPK